MFQMYLSVPVEGRVLRPSPHHLWTVISELGVSMIGARTSIEAILMLRINTGAQVAFATDRCSIRMANHFRTVFPDWRQGSGFHQASEN